MKPPAPDSYQPLVLRTARNDDLPVAPRRNSAAGIPTNQKRSGATRLRAPMLRMGPQGEENR